MNHRYASKMDKKTVELSPYFDQTLTLNLPFSNIYWHAFFVREFKELMEYQGQRATRSVTSSQTYYYVPMITGFIYTRKIIAT